MKIGNRFRCVSEICGWFPRVLRGVVPFPMYEVLELTAENPGIYDAVDLPFQFVVDDLGRWSWILARDGSKGGRGLVWAEARWGEPRKDTGERPWKFELAVASAIHR